MIPTFTPTTAQKRAIICGEGKADLRRFIQNATRFYNDFWSCDTRENLIADCNANKASYLPFFQTHAALNTLLNATAEASQITERAPVGMPSWITFDGVSFSEVNPEAPLESPQ